MVLVVQSFTSQNLFLVILDDGFELNSLGIIKSVVNSLVTVLFFHNYCFKPASRCSFGVNIVVQYFYSAHKTI